MGEAVQGTQNLNYMQGIPADTSYAPGPYSSGSSSSWLSAIKPASEAILGITGAVTKGYAKYSAYGREASYLESEANLAALDARLAAQEADLYDMQGDIIGMQHDINRWQIREKYIKKFSESRAKFAKSGINVGSGSAASVLSFIIEEGERETMIDEVNESGRMFSEVTMPKFRAESKAIAYGFKKTTKRNQADMMKSSQTTSLLGSTIDAFSGGKAGAASSLLDLGMKLTEKYA